MNEISAGTTGQEFEGQKIYASLGMPDAKPTLEAKTEASEVAVEHVLLEDAARMVATVANNEAKALTFVAMALRGSGSKLSHGQIYSLFIGMQGTKERAWPEIGHPVPGQYAATTFEPIGTVAKSSEATSRGFSDRFEVTAYGQRVGLAVTGLMLDLALEYPDVSLYEIFGKTGSKSPEQRRSPFTRLQLLQELLNHSSSPLSINNIAHEMLVIPSLVSSQVTALEKIGILEVARFQRGASDKLVTVTDRAGFDKVLLHPNKSLVPTLIHDYLKNQADSGNHSDVGIEDIIDNACIASPETPREMIRSAISETMANWEKEGFITTTSDFSQEQRSFVKIAPDKFQMIEDLMIRIRGIMEGDQSYLDWGAKRAAEILSDPEKVNLLLAKAKEASPFKHREPLSSYKARVIGLLLQAGEATAEALTDQIVESGKPTNYASVLRVLNILAAGNEVTYEVKSGKKFFKLKEP